jgi:hypothetical protein
MSWVPAATYSYLNVRRVTSAWNRWPYLVCCRPVGALINFLGYRVVVIPLAFVLVLAARYLSCNMFEDVSRVRDGILWWKLTTGTPRRPGRMRCRTRYVYGAHIIKSVWLVIVERDVFVVWIIRQAATGASDRDPSLSFSSPKKAAVPLHSR